MPVKDCDPELLLVLLAAFSRHLADSLPPELGLGDAAALFSILWGRLADPPGDPADIVPDTLPGDPADNVPDTLPGDPADTVPDAPAAAPDEPPQVPTASVPDGAATAAATAFQATPPASVPPDPGFRRFRSLRPDRRRIVRRRRAAAPRFSPERLQALPPRRLCYAACAGPP